MEPKDWISTGLEDEAAGVPVLEKQSGERTRRHRGIEVELRRKPGEGFGFVIASQDTANGKGKIQLLVLVYFFLIKGSRIGQPLSSISCTLLPE